MAHLHLENIGPISVVDIDLRRYNVFIGPQSSGKSTIAKLVSFCSWVEKRAATTLSENISRCDCAIADEEVFRFVEFKTNASGNTDNAYSQTYETAMRQLSSSIHLFADKTRQTGFPLKDKRRLSAHICTSIRFPRIQTSEIGYAVKFGLLEQLPLYFDSKISM